MAYSGTSGKSSTSAPSISSGTYSSASDQSGNFSYMPGQGLESGQAAYGPAP